MIDPAPLRWCALCVVFIVGCGGGDAPRAPVVARARDVAAPPSAIARDVIAQPPVDSFECRGPVDSCRFEACRDGLVCAAPTSFACGQLAPEGGACDAGSCVVTDEASGARVCLPEGCCGPMRPIGEPVACATGRPAAVEISLGGTDMRWTTCFDAGHGYELETLSATDGTLLVFARFDVGRVFIGAPKAISAVVRLPLDKLGGAFIHLGDATLLLDAHGQERVDAADATVLARDDGAPVEGTLTMGEVTPSRGRIDDLTLEGVELSFCARRGFACTFATRVEGRAVVLHAQTENGRLVEGFVASYRADGAEIFRARQLTSAPSQQQQVDLARFERLQPPAHGAAGAARVRITIAPD